MFGAPFFGVDYWAVDYWGEAAGTPGPGPGPDPLTDIQVARTRWTRTQ